MKKIHLVRISGVDYWRVEQSLEGGAPLVYYTEVVHEQEALNGWQLWVMMVMLYLTWEMPNWVRSLSHNKTCCEIGKKLFEHTVCMGCERLLFYVIVPLVMMIIGCNK